MFIFRLLAALSFAANSLRIELTTIAKSDCDVRGIIDHVMIGQHIAFLRIHDHTGPRTQQLAPRRRLRKAKEAAESWVSIKRIVRSGNMRSNREVDDGRGSDFNRRRNSENATAE